MTKMPRDDPLAAVIRDSTTPGATGAIPAATVIIARDADGGPEVLMVRRDSKLAFAAGMWVFPGGRLDPEDYGSDPSDLAGAEVRAAAREAEEEAGLAIDATSLRRWSHWTPPDMGQSHRFSTAFFVGRAPVGEVVIDDGEIRAHQWVRPADALELHRRGEVELAPPTYITLVQLNSPTITPSTSSPASRPPTTSWWPSMTATPATRPTTPPPKAPATA
jgi:8-oxo-dGTP pyrophosphatase MutT (NUDIX family)